MSIFVRQQHTINAFEGSGSWAILSPIERSIKQKIEAVGTPLKDWDINIYRGVLTGCNDAFIISTEKREEILSNCHDEAERERTEELIRPILRGRDIKRYGYNWANLNLVATFPSKHYNIDEYPSLKNYLLSYAKDYLLSNDLGWIADKHLADFCKQKLSQTGKPIIINGKKIIVGQKVEKARKKTSNKWFETQDSISYWDLFFQPHICWKAVGRKLAFALVEGGIYLTAPASFISAQNYNDLILTFLCSKVGTYYIYKNSDTTGAGDIMLNIQSLTKFPIPRIDGFKGCYTDDEKDTFVYSIYGLNNEEIKYIENSIL